MDWISIQDQISYQKKKIQIRRKAGRKVGSKGTGEDDEELQSILVVFQAGWKNRGFFFFYRAVDPLSPCRPHEQDAALMKQIVVVPRPLLVFFQLGETTSNYLPVSSDHVRRTRRVPQGSNPYIRVTVSVATEGLVLALAGRLVLSATFGFRGTTLSFFWRVLGFLVGVTLLGTLVSMRTNQCLEGSIQISQGLVGFFLLLVVLGWILGHRRGTDRKKKEIIELL